MHGQLAPLVLVAGSAMLRAGRSDTAAVENSSMNSGVALELRAVGPAMPTRSTWTTPATPNGPVVSTAEGDAVGVYDGVVDDVGVKEEDADGTFVPVPVGDCVGTGVPDSVLVADAPAGEVELGVSDAELDSDAEGVDEGEAADAAESA